MKLLRLATLYLRPPPEPFRPLTVTSELVRVSVLAHGPVEGELRVLVAAQVPLSSPPTLTEGQISVPEAARVDSERGIQFHANLTAVREGCSRQLRSPSIAVGFEPDNDADTQFLSLATRIARGSHAVFGVKPRIDTPAEQLTGILLDRQDGLALLAEALSHEHPTGQFHEYLRLFERAFSLGPSELIDPLSTFLEGSGQGFTRVEIEDWLLRLRHPTTHADRRPVFFLESDIRPVTWRMRQAAYDVLFNKDVWRDKSPHRRAAWTPPAWMSAPGDAPVIAKEGGSFQAQLQWLDDFGVFPLDLKAEIRGILPATWWVQPPDSREGSA